MGHFNRRKTGDKKQGDTLDDTLDDTEGSTLDGRVYMVLAWETRMI